MRKILILALLFSTQAWATIAFVNSGKFTTPAAANTAESITYTPVSGNTLYAWVYQTLAQSATITVDDAEGTGNVYSLIGSCVTSHSLVKGCMFRASNVSGSGSYTITAHSSANSFKAIMILEFSGVDNSAPADQNNPFAANSNTTPSAAVTTTNANDVLVSCFGDDNSNASVTFTAGSGYTKVQEENVGTTNFVGACEYRIVASTGTYNGNWTISTASDGVLVQIADKELAAATTVRRRVQITVSQ